MQERGRGIGRPAMAGKTEYAHSRLVAFGLRRTSGTVLPIWTHDKCARKEAFSKSPIPPPSRILVFLILPHLELADLRVKREGVEQHRADEGDVGGLAEKKGKRKKSF